MQSTINKTAAVVTDLSEICQKASDELVTLEGKCVYISGSAGFLGYYLVQALLKWNKDHPSAQPISVIAADHFPHGIPEWLLQLQPNSSLQILRHDVNHEMPDEIGDLDYIIHAASIASPFHYRLYPLVTMDANVNGLRLLLERSRRQQDSGKPLEGFLYFSTSEIYGDPGSNDIPTPETYRGYVSCTGPRACYDESKRFGETLCVNFAKQYGLPIQCARPFNNYGPGLSLTDRRIIPDLARDILDGRDLVLFSDGTPTRTYCYITDAIAGYYKVLTRGRPGESYNIGNDQPEISVLGLAVRFARIAKELFGYNGCVSHGVSCDRDYLTDNPKRRCPDLQKARSQLGYNPTVNLDDGIGRTLLWYQEEYMKREVLP